MVEGGKKSNGSAHVHAGGGHGGTLAGQQEFDAQKGKVDRNRRVVKSVNRLAYSCRGINWCDRGSSCALVEN